MATLADKYRPESWDEVVGHDRVVKRLLFIKQRFGTLGGRAYWISGPSGIGKTTIARLIAGDLAGRWGTWEGDAQQVGLELLKQFERRMLHRSLDDSGKTGQAFIVNEAHGLRRDVVRALLVLLEDLPSHCVWVFTTTRAGQAELFESKHDAPALLSRCVVLELSSYGVLDAFARRVYEIAEREGLLAEGNGAMEPIKRLLKKHRNNMRAVLQEVESGALL